MPKLLRDMAAKGQSFYGKTAAQAALMLGARHSVALLRMRSLEDLGIRNPGLDRPVRDDGAASSHPLCAGRSVAAVVYVAVMWLVVD